MVIEIMKRLISWVVKTAFCIFALIGIAFTSLYVYFATTIPFDPSIMRHEDMTLEKMMKKWGDHPFDSKRFLAGDSKIRESMMYDLIRSKKYMNKTLQEVEDDFGTPDHWNSEHIEYTVKNATNGWLSAASFKLKFIFNRKKVIKKIGVERICCISYRATWIDERGYYDVD